MIETIPGQSSLATRLRDQIAREGRITFRDWMAAALYDAEGGYYCSEQIRWGREGDYRTSPERSELFAATFARYFAKLYRQLGEPEQWIIGEAGGGNGSFAAGVLQTLETYFPEIFAATSYLIDEISAPSRAIAAERLDRFGERVEFKRLNDLQPFAGIVFSNELLDAFPVHRLVVQEGRLFEFYVESDASGQFKWTVDEPSRLVVEFFEKSDAVPTREGQIVELNLDAEAWLHSIAGKIQGGYLVTVDYGADHPGDTLRGFRRHQFVDDLLSNPGTHDLTTSVDWNLVRQSGAQLNLKEIVFEQLDKFLLSAGLLEQLELESQELKTDAERLRLRMAAREMILPNGMAASFQVLVQQK